ncbi:hypothetical protein GE09DRAFT_1289902 [Coniochaeta sp. 2T2.1]|nr:hypothetical protein GE09DRAFT_1289902 [Coniochaeta sp. 2T2.1]
MAFPTPAIKIEGQPYGVVAETEEVFSDEEVLDDAPTSGDEKEAINYVFIYTYAMPVTIHHPPTSRPRPRQRYQDDEYVGIYLELGDWEGVETLTYSETLHLLNKLHKTREKTRRRVEYNELRQYEVIRQARECVEAVANYPTPESTVAVENLLRGCTVLHPFERAMLGSLGFQDAEEAKALVKSLDGRFDEADVGAMDWDGKKKLLLRVDLEIEDEQISELGVAGTLSMLNKAEPKISDEDLQMLLDDLEDIRATTTRLH